MSDALTFFLLLDSLESILTNHFQDPELRICEIISLLLSICLHSNFNPSTTQTSVLLLKNKAASLLQVLLKSCPGRTDLQQECSNLLLKAMLKGEPDGYQFIGSLMGLSKLGPHMAIQSLIKNIAAVKNQLLKLEQLAMGSLEICTKARQVIFEVFQEVIQYLEVYKLAENAET